MFHGYLRHTGAEWCSKRCLCNGINLKPTDLYLLDAIDFAIGTGTSTLAGHENENDVDVREEVVAPHNSSSNEIQTTAISIDN